MVNLPVIEVAVRKRTNCDEDRYNGRCRPMAAGKQFILVITTPPIPDQLSLLPWCLNNTYIKPGDITLKATHSTPNMVWIIVMNLLSGLHKFETEVCFCEFVNEMLIIYFRQSNCIARTFDWKNCQNSTSLIFTQRHIVNLYESLSRTTFQVCDNSRYTEPRYAVYVPFCEFKWHLCHRLTLAIASFLCRSQNKDDSISPPLFTP